MQEAPLLERLERLEKQNADLRENSLARAQRRLRRNIVFFAGYVGLFCLCIYLARERKQEAPSGTPKTSSMAGVVEAKRFVLRGTDGEEACAISLDSEGFPQILMRKGESHALLTLNGPGLLIRGADGRRGAFMGIDAQGMTTLSLASERVLDGMKLAVKPDGSSGLYLLDQRGYSRMGFEASEAAGANIVLRDKDGAVRSSLGVDPNAVPSLLFFDAVGRRRAGMLVDESGKPLMAIQDEGGNPRLELTSHFDGSGRLRVRGEDGRIVFEAP